MATQYFCQNLFRRQAVAEQPNLNGIDYLEVGPSQTILTLFFIHDLAAFSSLSRDNVVISGGARIKGADLEPAVSQGELRVVSVSAAGNRLTVAVNTPGDFSSYTLRLIQSPANLRPPSGFDPQLAEVDFSFKVDCPSDFDCAPADVCPPDQLPEPEINYLAKDYASFRQLLLDRLSVVMPDWSERNPADLMVTLVELLAYAGDHLSYYQDAVATEAYLGTARQRTSLRRHARLLDYFMHEGSSARAWVCFQVDNSSPPLSLPEGAQLLTRGPNEAPTVNPAGLPQLLSREQPEVFETLHPVTLHPARNEIEIYTWSDLACCLPAGATRATLKAASSLTLAKGEVLIFEELLSPTTGRPTEADPSRRWAVRLTEVDPTAVDPLFEPPLPLIDITWHADDALPFPLCLSAIQAGDLIAKVSVARGIVVLTAHGRRVSDETLPVVPTAGPYRPSLNLSPLSRQRYRIDPASQKLIWFEPSDSAASMLRAPASQAQPWISLHSAAGVWLPRRDLLNSDRFARDFVVETETGSATALRFGDGILGRRPATDQALQATYRVGNGPAGNVGAAAIARLVTPLVGIERVWNPLPAVGGVAAESPEQVGQFAPQAFRTQERAVTEVDYADVTQRRTDVQRAVANLRWTGSWYTAVVAVDRRGGLPVEAEFKQELQTYLNRYRLAGYDLEIAGPRFVPLDLAFFVCAKSGYFHSQVKERLLDSFSSQNLATGERGFFHPDNFTFGQSLYLSRIYEVALSVAGVETVEVTRFQRWGRVANQELERGVLLPGPTEVIRLDNDPNFPENGKLEVVVQGGL